MDDTKTTEKGGPKVKIATVAAGLQNIGMKLHWFKSKRKTRKVATVVEPPKEMSFTEIMHLITKRPIIDNRTRETRQDTVVEINPS